MGAYINPENETKEIFLAREAKPISLEKAKEHDDYKEVLLVVLVQNSGFSAAAIAFSEREKQEFLDPTDLRSMTYFLVNFEKLLKVSNLHHYYLKV